MPPPMGGPRKGGKGPIEKAKDFKGTTKKLVKDPLSGRPPSCSSRRETMSLYETPLYSVSNVFGEFRSSEVAGSSDNSLLAEFPTFVCTPELPTPVTPEKVAGSEDNSLLAEFPAK